MANWLFRSIAALLIALLASAHSWAKDVYGDQIWFRGALKSTVQHWQFTTNTQTNIVPESYTNPYGTPLATISGNNVEWSDDWPAPLPLEPGGFLPGWHYPEGGTAICLVHNDPLPNAQKIIITQITSSKAPLSVSLDLPLGYTYNTFDTGFPTVNWGEPAPFDGSWSTYVYGFQVNGNPEWESILISFPPCSTLEQTLIDTICIPEPATLCMLLAGGIVGLLLYAWRKRR